MPYIFWIGLMIMAISLFYAAMIAVLAVWYERASHHWRNRYYYIIVIESGITIGTWCILVGLWWQSCLWIAERMGQ